MNRTIDTDDGKSLLDRLEDAEDACRAMAGWTYSAVRAHDYQEAGAALRSLKEILEEARQHADNAMLDGDGPTAAHQFALEQVAGDLIALLSEPAGPTGGEPE